MTSRYTWQPRKRNFQLEKQDSYRSVVFSHPLRPKTVLSKTKDEDTTTDSKNIPNGVVPTGNDGPQTTAKGKADQNKKTAEFVDPLGATVDGSGVLSLGANVDVDFTSVGLDPLNRLSHGDAHHKRHSESDILINSLTLEESVDTEVAPDELEPLADFEPWSSKRLALLQQFTTDEKMTICSSFLPGGVPLPAQITVSDRTAHRVEQFDDTASLRRLDNLTQQDYVNAINQLNAALQTAWASDQRVQSVKIVIQCAKLLSDSVVPKFYPSQFVLVTDVFDTFGRLVYDRLWSKANAERKAAGKPPLGRHFTPEDIPDSTQETARNWFYKIASVRELLPRFYVETAILRCYRFILPTTETFRNALFRLAEMIRGIGNPLVAAYAACYVCRVGAGLLSPAINKEHCWRCLHQMLAHSDRSTPATPSRNAATVSMEHLIHPALEWLLQCLSYGSTEEDAWPIWEYCKRPEKRSLLLLPVLRAFPSRQIAANAGLVCQLVLNDERRPNLSNPSHLELTLLGRRLLDCEPSPGEKQTILRDVWRVVMKYAGVAEYLECAQVWIEFACMHFGSREVNTLLEDLLRHVQPDQVYEQYYPQLLVILNRIVNSRLNFDALFGMERFIVFLDLFRKDSVRLQACRCVLQAFSHYQMHSGGDDLELSNQVLTLCRSIHDSLNALSLDDEKRSTVLLICRSLDRFHFDDNDDQLLSFLVEARGAFSNLDPVIEYLVHRCNRLIMRVKSRKKTSRKSAYFVRACVAYNYITVPSIVDHFIRLKLYIESAQTALVNFCLPQADALLKAAISLIPEVPSFVDLSANRRKPTDIQVLECLECLLSLLLVVPDPPEMNQPLYLIKGLFNAMQRFNWSDSLDYKATALVALLRLLSTAAQTDYPYHIIGVESNDTLYGCSEAFLEVVTQTSSEVLNQLLAYCKSLADRNESKRQATVMFDLFECVTYYGDLKSESIRKLAANLRTLLLKLPIDSRQRVKLKLLEEDLRLLAYV